MKNKINPRQYEPYSLSTPSGNLAFEEGVDFFNCFLLNELTGDFNFIGDLKINTGNILVNDPESNTDFVNNNISLNSNGSFITGTNNVIINSPNSEASGDSNLILGGSDNSIVDSDFSAVLFGVNCSANHTGSAIIGDGNSSFAKTTNGKDTLTINFASGIFLESETFLNSNLAIGGDLNISQFNSGLFSGDINVLGTAYNTGSPLQNLQNVKNTSGHLLEKLEDASGDINIDLGVTGSNLHDRLESTGSYLYNQIISTGSFLYTGFDSRLKDTGSYLNTKITTGINLLNLDKVSDFSNFSSLTGDQFNLAGTGRTVPTTYFSNGNSGDITWDAEYLYVCTGTNLWGRVQVSPW